MTHHVISANQEREKDNLAMAAPLLPNGEDVSAIGALFDWLKSWGGATFGAGSLLGLVWTASGKSSRLDRHERSINEHEDRLKGLETSRSAANEKIAALPTRDELRAETTQINRRLEGLSDQITQLIIPRHRD